MSKTMTKPTDLDCIKNDKCWGLWPYLPIKRYPQGKSIECGLLRVYETQRCIQRGEKLPVFSAFVYKLPPTVEEFLATKFLEYDSVEALIADGWVIDD